MAHNPNENHKGVFCSDLTWGVNNTGIYYPDGNLPYDNESIQGEDTGRTEDGTMHIDWVAGKLKIHLKWSELTGHEVKHMKQLFFMKEFTFHFVDLGEACTATMYCTTFSYTQVSQDDGYKNEGGLYEDITCNVIEI